MHNDGELCLQSGAKVVKKVLETKSNDVAVGVVALDGRDNVRRVLKEHGVSEELLAFMVTDTGSAVYFQWGDKLVYSEEWQRKVKFRWHADTVRKAIMRASGNRHAVTTQSKPQSTIEEELQDLMEAVRAHSWSFHDAGLLRRTSTLVIRIIPGSSQQKGALRREPIAPTIT